MDQTGLITKLFAVVDNNWESHDLLQQSRERRDLDKSLGLTLNVLKSIAKSKDISVIFAAESLMLEQELERHANSPEESNSIKMAITQLDTAHKSLNTVREPRDYRAAAETYSPKRMEAGLPLDSCREFLKSHSTRLTNRLASPLTVPEKNILRQRKENLGVAKDIYVGLQREALGLPLVHGKEKGLGL